MPGLIGKKVGMTSVYNASGKNLPCTVLEVGPCVVTQVRTLERDGYEAVQLGYGERSEKHTSKAMQGHFKRAGVAQPTHGQHNRLRAPGSIGAASTPARVFKGMRMGGQMGNEKVKVQNLRVLKVVPEKNLLVVKGCVPGHK